MIVSCRAHLDSRIPALRRAWIEGLQALGIPVLVVVGGADGPARHDGAVLHLPVSDDDEGRPQKVLAAFDWLDRHSPAAHVVKLDDDCFLDGAAFFHAPGWRAFPYHGRRLEPGPRQMDRARHQARSASTKGRLEYDKSPENSAYCDGASGYVLSRGAIGALSRVSRALAGQELIRNSFQEDKLVGDLLALAEIAPETEDCRVSVRRRSAAGATAAEAGASGLMPLALSGTGLTRPDDVAALPETVRMAAAPMLDPPRIWPTRAPLRLGRNAHQLELLSPVEKLARLNRAPLAVVSVMRNETVLLPHFLAHYRALGVQAFLVADNLSDDGTLESLLAEPDVVTFSVESDYRSSDYGVAWQQAILGHFRVGRWSLMADADEFLVPGEGGLAALLAGAGEAEAFRVFMLDLYPRGPLSEARFAAGPFAEARFADREPFLAQTAARGPFADQPTWTSALRHRLMPGSRPELFVAQKMALLKYLPWMRLSAGLHYVADARLARREPIFAHFKYHAEFAARARVEVARRQHFNDAEEYRKYLEILAEGRETLFDPAVSMPWQEIDFVRRRLSD